MSKRLSSQGAKRSSAFTALIQAHEEPEGTAAIATKLAVKGKSADPNYMKLTSYVRRDTHRAVKRRLLDEDKEISELVEELLVEWLGSRV